MRRQKLAAAFVGALAVWLCLVLSNVGCKPFEAAWRTTGAIKSAASLTDKAVATAALAAHNACLAKHKVKTPEYKGCMAGSKGYQALTKWRKFGKPAINSALIATVAAIQIAERAKQKLNWISLLHPAACALARMVEQFKGLFGKEEYTIMAAARLVKGATCPR